MVRVRLLLFGLFALAFAFPSLPISQSADPPSANAPSFQKDVVPFLTKHCYACHGPEVDKVQGGLRLDQRMGWQVGGDSGDPSVIPGDSSSSLLELLPS